MDWKGNNPGPKGQVRKEGPGHGAAWDRDSEQEPGWLWVITVTLGTKGGAAGRNASMTCSTQPSWKLNAPGRQGANTAKPKLSPTTPQPGFWGTAWEQGEPLCSPGILGHCQQQPLSVGASLTPAGKWHCHIWMCHHEPGNCQGQRCKRGAQLRDG